MHEGLGLVHSAEKGKELVSVLFFCLFGSGLNSTALVVVQFYEGLYGKY
jgi:hypothetical protein